MRDVFVESLLNASASNAGTIISNATFEIPQFQREYSWGIDEVTDFWSDLHNALQAESYFLGLLILTNPAIGDGPRKHVVDGQQRLITLSLLATAIYHAAVKWGRKALAERILADFLRSLDYVTDETQPRICLSDNSDNVTFQALLATGRPPIGGVEEDSVSSRMVASYEFLERKLSADLASDPFKRLGQWTDFITNNLYFAVFLHPDTTSAYQVYEVVNTRGKDLTTADLLKNYVLSQTRPPDRNDRYAQWQRIAKSFAAEGANNFVQYIRHVVTVRYGHVLPKDLFGFLAGRIKVPNRSPPSADELMQQLEYYLPLYRQMIDPSLAGPADDAALRVFSALNSLSVIAVRPILLAMFDTSGALHGMHHILKLVVRRIIVGNLGTGNVERRFGEAAKAVFDARDWRVSVEELSDLDHSEQDFVDQLKKRSFNKQVLAFIRRSVVQGSITPDSSGILHYIWTRTPDFGGMDEDEGSFWASTIGNVYLATVDRRPSEVRSWPTFKEYMLPQGVMGEWGDYLAEWLEWDSPTVESVGLAMAQAAGGVWFDHA